MFKIINFVSILTFITLNSTAVLALEQNNPKGSSETNSAPSKVKVIQTHPNTDAKVNSTKSSSTDTLARIDEENESPEMDSIEELNEEIGAEPSELKPDPEDRAMEANLAPAKDGLSSVNSKIKEDFKANANAKTNAKKVNVDAKLNASVENNKADIQEVDTSSKSSKTKTKAKTKEKAAPKTTTQSNQDLKSAKTEKKNEVTQTPDLEKNAIEKAADAKDPKDPKDTKNVVAENESNNDLSVIEFVLATDVNGREPQKVVESFDSNHERGYAYARLCPKQTSKVTFVWYRNNTEYTRKTLPVMAAKQWRTFSSIKLRPGHWKVELLSETGEVLAEKTFTLE